MKTNDEEYTITLNYYKGKRESKLKSDIKRETNIFRKNLMEKVYHELKKTGEFKEK